MYNYDLNREFNRNKMELLQIGDHYEVWGRDGSLLFEGTKDECEAYIDDTFECEDDEE